MGTLKPQSNGPYDNTVIGTARRRLDGARPRRHRCTKCNSPPPHQLPCVPITVLLYNDPLLCVSNVPFIYIFIHQNGSTQREKG